MEDSWIKVSHCLESGANGVEDIKCKISFNDVVSVIIDEDDIDYLIDKLNTFKENRVMLMTVKKVEKLLEVNYLGE